MLVFMKIGHFHEDDITDKRSHWLITLSMVRCAHLCAVRTGFPLGMYQNSRPAGFQKSSGSGRNHHWFRPEQNSLKNSIFIN